MTNHFMIVTKVKNKYDHLFNAIIKNQQYISVNK